MVLDRGLKQQLHINDDFAVRFIAIVVAAHGVYILATTLLAQIAAHRGSHLNDLIVDVPLLIGLSLLYLSTLLRRRKRTAWLVTVMAYVVYLALGIEQLLRRTGFYNIGPRAIIHFILLPLIVLLLLLAFQKDFIVKSDVQGFRSALRFVAIILIVALIYGVAGFILLDQSDFHQEIPFGTAVHYTVDQFNLTTPKPLHPYTKRAQLFTDSLSFVSLVAVLYAAFSLFQPLRQRFSDQHLAREQMTGLLYRYGALSEDFFKVWPHDKSYFFDDSGRAGLAFRVYQGVALCVSDPAGDPSRFKSLINDFRSLCFNNDWLPSFIHTTEAHRQLYEAEDFSLQKLGQEAVVELSHFQKKVAGNKYFRQINNKFSKQGYSCELLVPPHHPDVLDRLQIISKDWLSRGGRAERGFMMGYYTDAYMQQCQILVARDAAGTIRGFVNLVPADFDRQEADYDLMRHAQGSPGNLNDFMLLNLIDQLSKDGYQRLNLGLCPLVGLDEADQEQRSLIDGVLQFAYTNGGRFYSFNGLYKFKSKYEPQWRDRYVAYQGGLRGFSRAMTALTRCMRSVVKT